ncbi:MAG TPA: peptidase E [Thermoleophilaceae bacterium]
MSGHIVAIGGGALEETGPLLRFLLGLAGRESPRVCFVPTASGDDASYVANFYRAFSELECVPSDLTLFDRKYQELAPFVRAQDVFYVGGGNTANLLAVWRVHGLDELLREAYERGAVLSGTSAGMNCWFDASTTDSFGKQKLAPLNDGLGLLKGSACPHYDAEEQRRSLYHDLIANGFPAGYAADNQAAIHFKDGDLVEAVSCKETARAYRVELQNGEVREQELPTQAL